MNGNEDNLEYRNSFESNWFYSEREDRGLQKQIVEEHQIKVVQEASDIENLDDDSISESDQKSDITKTRRTPSSYNVIEIF